MNSFNNRAGHCIPLWRDADASQPNVTADLLDALATAYGQPVPAEDLFAYTYAVLASPHYVECFSEELTVPGPRLPLTRDAALFAEAVAAGRTLIHLHTYGERYLPKGGNAGQVPQGSARLKTPIPDTAAGYPENYDYDPAARTLRVGDGLVAEVAPEVFGFSVSGFEVVKSWLNYRRKAGAGRKSSPLDDIRPERWTVAMSQELLQLLWLLEHTLAQFPQLSGLLDRIVAGPLFAANALPQPSAAQRHPPGRDENESVPIQANLVGL